MGRLVCALVLLVVFASGFAGAGAAHAQGSRATIALIPFTAEKRLRLYGKPVAAEVTRALRDAGLDVQLVSDGDPVPARARLVVDGRLVKRGGGVVIESRIRDPERGVDVARPSGAAASLDDIDHAASAVAAELVVAIRAGLATQDDQAARAAAALSRPAPPTGPTPPDHPTVRVPPRDSRPLAIVVVSAPGLARDKTAPTDVAPLFAPAAVELARRLGHRAAVETAPAPPAPPIDPQVASQRRASLLVGFELLSFTSGTQRDIPVARARARVTVFDASGKQLYRRIVRTDTLVGSRGDRVDTLIRFAAAQVTDVAAPRIRERLEAR
ncbi:MAG TPA: hypothetical protein VM261_01715 [Kofleriaceae bacterium]|nr:hypothetical protein [Kofleriaceae bacterium]